jgi:undecaprenyl-diphosphatase
MDWRIFRSINDFSRSTPWLHSFLRAYANYGVVLFALGLLAALVVGLRDDARMVARSLWTGIAALIALAVNQPIADAVGRVRPFAAHPHVLVLVDKAKDPGFMSDHSLVAGAVAVGLVLTVRRIGFVVLGLAAVMLFARVYVGVHYPGDVLAGFAFGGFVAAAGMPLADRLLTPMCERLRSLPVFAGIRRPAST